MSDTLLTPSAAQAFLKANPAVDWVDLLLFDMNGIARGKRVRAGDLSSVSGKGIMLPASVFSIDSVGHCAEETGLLWETGDADQPCGILANTLKVVPLDAGRRAQAVILMEGVDDLDPQAMLVRQVKRLSRRGLTAVAAVELEFYLSTPLSDAAPAPRMPAQMRGDAERPGVYEFADLDALKPVLDTIYAVAEGVGLPVDAILQESGPGQLEINLKHYGNVVGVARDALLLRRAVRQAAQQHGLDATFMAKPHAEWAGSGMHIHVSLIDETGHNAFAGDPIAPCFAAALKGLVDTMPDFMAIWAQTANAYRRYALKSYVPMTAQWGINNRTVSLRVPAGTPEATRVEHRVAGADANPVLVLAAVLAGIEQGIAAGEPVGPPVVGDAARVAAPALPLDWASALNAFARSEAAAAAFGTRFRDVFAALKQAERGRFERVVGPTDHLWYSRG